MTMAPATMDSDELKTLIEQEGGVSPFCRRVSRHPEGDWISPNTVWRWLKEGKVPHKWVPIVQRTCGR